jgi:DNA-binding transcriptional MerR regulator
LKVSPARLRHWKRTALAQSEAPALDASGQPDFDFRDLVCVRAMLSLVDRGISVRRIRSAIAVLQENLPDLDDPLAALRLWDDVSERIVVQHEGVLSEPEGQMVLDFGDSSAGCNDPAPIGPNLRRSHGAVRARMRARLRSCHLPGCNECVRALH